MKRDAYGDNGPSHKRQRHYSDDDEVTFLIPSKVAGSIIGKGGTNISKLRSQFKASITVPDCPGPERVLTIATHDVESLLDVVKDILPNLSDNGPMGKGRNDDYDDDSNASNLDVRVLIHQSRAGCVIGKAGSKIKELREETGARVKIFTNPAPQSTERVVQLRGNAEAVIAGLREVIRLVRPVPIKGPIQNYDPHNYDDYYADEYGGYGGGQGRGNRGGPAPRGPPGGGGLGGRGPPPRGGGPPMGRGPPPPRPFNDFGSGGPGPSPGPGPRNNFGPPRGNFGPGGGNFGPSSGNFGPSSGNFGGNMSGGGGNRGPPGNFGGNVQETSTQVTIPTDLAGAIIGRSGSRIRKIRMDSGADIEIAEASPGQRDRVITITGTPRQIQCAQYLLQQRMFEEFPGLATNNN